MIVCGKIIYYYCFFLNQKHRKLRTILKTICARRNEWTVNKILCFADCSSTVFFSFPSPSLLFYTLYHLSLSSPSRFLLTGGLPRAGLLFSWTSAGPCGVAKSSISPVLVGAMVGWIPSLLGLVMITIWWSSPRLILPEFSRVSKSARRSSDVWPEIRVSDMALTTWNPFSRISGVLKLWLCVSHTI